MITPETLTAYQRELAAFYLGRVSSGTDAAFVRFSFASSTPHLKADVDAIRIRIRAPDGSSLWFSGSLADLRTTTPATHHHQFIGTFDDEGVALTELLAAAAHYDVLVSRLQFGDTFPIGLGSSVRASGYEAAVVLRGATDPQFRNATVPPSLATTVFFVMPITASELRLKRERGLDALLDERQRTRVPPYAIRRPLH